MGDFKLSATLQGHEDDVRSIVFPDPNVILSASRDGTVRTWKIKSTSPPEFDDVISSHSSTFVNALTYLSPKPEFPEGLIISGGKDTIIDVRQPGRSPDDNAEALLLGHAGNICALDVDPTGQWVVSGAWDAQSRVWPVGKWECEAVLEGHEGSVWAVLAWSSELVITGCADKLIRVFKTDGTLVRTIRGTNEVIRALCRVPKDHPSRAQFAAASNDGVIRLWTLEGRQVGELLGHDSFIYSLASLPSGELVSSGEDRTLRIWQGSQCVQTITHPAISVWSVAACAANGDIVSGASDRIVRVFSREKSRHANQTAIQEFEESVKSSSIPQQQVGDINKEKLPGPDFLDKKSGTKEGQVVMIRENDGSVTAHQWSTATRQWISVGSVVDAVGSSGRKQEYLGKDYDYVFDVDIKEGAPALKLPYNLSQNPYEAATKFLQDNELPMGYLDQVANFITSNTQGATIGQGQQAQPTGPDPYGIESRYRPGEVSSQSQQPAPPAAPSKVLPQTTYLSIKQANLKAIQKKIEDLNRQLVENGNKDLSLNPSELAVLQDLIAHLEHHPPQSSAKAPAAAAVNGLELVIKLVTVWPAAQRLPGLDLLRLLAAETSAPARFKGPRGENIVDVLEKSGVFEDQDRGNNIMLAIRAFANLFETAEGHALADAEFDKIQTLTTPLSLRSTTNRNLQISYTTLQINYSVHLTSAATSAAASSPVSSSSSERALTLLEPLSSIIDSVADSEVVYRALVAAGTLLVLGDEVRVAARDVFALDAKARAARERFREPRVSNVVAEILGLLG